MDAAAPFSRDGQPRRETASVSLASQSALRDYEQLCDVAVHAPPQGPLWVRNWSRHHPDTSIIATLSVDGRPVFALALEMVALGPLRIARFMGGCHANGNFPATDPTLLDQATPTAFAALFDALAGFRPAIDVVLLDRLLPVSDAMPLSRPNPLLALRPFDSPDISLAVNLSGGFEAMIASPEGRGKHKRYRSQARKFAAAGTCRRIEATNSEEVDRLLDAFFEMKAARFASMGITDVFAPPDVRAFFRNLFAEPLREPSPPFVLHGLEVAGKLRAITGSSRCGNRLICEFGSISEDELCHLSPGNFLFFDNIREASEQGFTVYDFSIGDEPYKRQWCDTEIRYLETLIPLTAAGKAYAFAHRQKVRLKTRLKQSPALWPLLKNMRRILAGRPAKKDSD